MGNVTFGFVSPLLVVLRVFRVDSSPGLLLDNGTGETFSRPLRRGLSQTMARRTNKDRNELRCVDDRATLPRTIENQPSTGTKKKKFRAKSKTSKFPAPRPTWFSEIWLETLPEQSEASRWYCRRRGDSR